MTQERTQDEIVERIRSIRQMDIFGFETDFLACYLDFEHAREFLIDDAKASEWNSPAGRSREAIVSEIVDYLPFAWGKANNCRGLSAGRSMTHMKVWLWMLGADAAADAVEDYDLYGKPHLAAISDAVGFDWRAEDNGEWVNSEGGVPRAISPSEHLDLSALTASAAEGAS